MSEPFIGEIRLFAFNFAPRFWATCDGQLLSIAQNPALFSLLGTTYGGNGQTTFALPDLRGRVATGLGALSGGSNYTIGEAAGVESVTLLTTQLPAHTHPVAASTGAATTNVPSGAVLAAASTGVYASPASLVPTAMTTVAGSAQAHTNLQPGLVVNACIAIYGIFPSRN